MSEGAAIIQMIERAARDPSVDLDKMERMFAMHERVQDRRAKADFLNAFSMLQADLPAVARRGTGHNSKKYARFEDLVETIKGPLAAHGFSLGFRLEHGEKTVGVIGVLGHAGGHSEETKIILLADASGSKNAVQAWGSSVSYGKRYVAMTLLGIATADEDDDGKAATLGGTISEDQENQIREALEATGSDIHRFCAYFKLDKLSDLPASKFKDAMTALGKKKRASP